MTRVEPDMHQEMGKRCKLIEEANRSPDLQADLMEMCKRDILFRFRNFAYTDKNTRMFGSDDPSILPFIPFPFQEDAVMEIWSSIMNGTKPLSERTDLTNVFIEKSRQMGLSWLIIAIFVYGFIFHNHKYHVISQKEDYVDKLGDIKSLFGKARFLINNLPKWMLPKGFDRKEGGKHLKYMVISRPDGTGAITGESANPNAARSGTFNAILLDEYAFQNNATAINKSAASATPTRIFNSTPNGEGNEHHRMRKLTVPVVDVYGNVKEPQIKGLRYHWRDHPLRDEAWYENEKKGMSREQVAQELDIQYNTAIVGRVYPDFPTEAVHIEYDPNLPLYVRLDNSHGGADPHAAILVQLKENTIDFIDSIEVNCSVTDMAEFMSGKPKATLTGLTDEQLVFLDRYRKYDRPKATFVDDPYDTHSKLNQSTIYEEYRKVGIYLNTPMERSKKQQIQKTSGNIYKIRYNENCLDAASAIMNAKYPERPEGSSSTAENANPVHDWTCLHGDTRIRTLSGYKPIKELVGQDFYVRGYSHTEKRLVPAKAIKCRETKTVSELIEITLDDGSKIKCTPDHRFLLRDGETYVEAQNLSVSDSLMPMYENINRKYNEVKLNDGTTAVEHKFVYTRYNGYLKDGHHIHHKDSNKYNNNPENLEQLTMSEHCKITRPHESVDYAWVEQKQSNLMSQIKVCPNCKKEFMGNYKMIQCSKKCTSKMFQKRRRENRLLDIGIQKVCVRCKEQFIGYNRDVTCSKVCTDKRTDNYNKVYSQNKHNGIRIKMRDLDKNNHKVKAIRYISETTPVYDIETETHNFVAEGVVLHNCHFRTAMEYGITYMLENPVAKKAVNPHLSDRPHHNSYLYTNRR